jgi:branched-chain amino acid transport system substrate-binding protein
MTHGLASQRKVWLGRGRPRMGLSALAAASAIMLLLAGCSSSKHSGTGSAASNPRSNPTNAPGGGVATGSTIAIGVSIPLSTGPQGPVNSDTKATLTAWQEWTNANGGINGHPVKVIALDDMGNPGRELTNVRTLVENNHVVAIALATPDPVNQYLTQKQVPLVGPQDFGELDSTSPIVFPTETSSASIVWSIADTGKQAGTTRMGDIYCVEQTACTFALQGLKHAIAQLGLQFTVGEAVSASAPDYTAACLAQKSAGSTSIYTGLGTVTAVKIVNDCLRQGFKPTYLIPVPDNILNQLKDVKAAGNDVDLPYFATGVPATQTFHNAMDKYAKGVELHAESIREWTALQVLATGLKNSLRTESPSPKAAVDGLYSLGPHFSAGGLAPPLSYVRGKGTYVPCFFLWSLHNGEFSMNFGTKPYCEPAKDLPS